MINSLPKNLSADVSDKTFNVFDPYPERRKIFHNMLFALLLLSLCGKFLNMVFY